MHLCMRALAGSARSSRRIVAVLSAAACTIAVESRKERTAYSETMGPRVGYVLSGCCEAADRPCRTSSERHYAMRLKARIPVHTFAHFCNVPGFHADVHNGPEHAH